MPRNEIGFDNQRNNSDDISNLLECGPLEVSDIAEQLGDSIRHVKRQVTEMKSNGEVTINKDEDDWVVEAT